MKQKTVHFVIVVIVWMLVCLAPSTSAAAFGALGNEFVVNTETSGTQNYPAIAVDGNGNGVIVWGSSMSGVRNIYGRRFNAAGTLLGEEFLISTDTTGAYPEVDMTITGNFVVAWQGFDGVRARLYDSVATPQTDPILVGTNSDTSLQPVNVAMSEDGNFVVVWERLSSTLFARLYNASGVAQTDEFSIIGSQSTPRIAMNATGNFIVTWTAGSNVYAQRYNAAGTSQGSAIQVNTSTGASYSAIGMDDNGNFVICWQDSNDDADVFAQRFNAAGAPVGSEFVVNTTISFNQGNPWIAMNASGAFVIVWEAAAGQVGIYARRYDSSGNAQGAEFTISEQPAGFAVAAMDANSNFVAAYMAGSQDIYARRLGEFDLNAHLIATNEFLVNTYTASNQALSSVAMNNAGNFVITWQSNSQDGQGWGVYAQRYNALGTPQGSEFLVNTVTAFTQQSPTVAMAENGNFVIAWSGSSSGDSIKSQRYNAAGVAQGGEIIVSNPNAFHPQIAMDDAGNFIVVWDKFSSSDIYARRFSTNGTPLGAEFMVNTTTANEQTYPRVAMDADGDFVVTWMSGVVGISSDDIYAQRYNAAGIAQGSEFRVNTYTANSQSYPAVGMDSTGNFVVAWHGEGNGDTFGVFAQRYNALGAAQGSEFRVNMSTLGPQGISWVAMNDNGNFIVIWEGGVSSQTPDVFARSYDTMGTAQTDEFLVNVETAAYQGFFVSGALNTNGNYVITWLSQANSAAQQDVYARLFGTLPTLTSITENDFYAAFEAERVAFPAIAQGIADFVVGGINLTVTLNTGEAGRVTFTVTDAAGFVSIQISSITALNGGAASQAYIDTINRDLPSLLTAALDNLVLARFGAGQDVQSITIDSTTMTIGVLP
ncbi:MAG: hypothetical protein U0694_23210 [Anaerolineae bacterium]